MSDKLHGRGQDHDPSHGIEGERASEKLPFGLVTPTHFESLIRHCSSVLLSH
jgi:hypothetical protein